MRFLTLFSLFLPVCFAAVQAASASPFEQEGEKGSPHGEAPDVAAGVTHRQARVVSLILALDQTLAPVTDKASADAAAPAVLRLACDFRQVQEESQSERGMRAEKAMDDWRLQHGKDFARLTEKAFGKAVNLLLDNPSCHGSSALEGALLQLFSVLEEREPEDIPAT